MTDDDDKHDEAGHPRKEEVVQLFQRGLKFTEELLAENERLRFRVASLEAEIQGTERVSGSPDPESMIFALKQQIRELEEERTRLLKSFKSVEEKNRDYQVRYAEIEEEHNNLANLYIASYQLHSTLSFREVMQIITEIVINLVGVMRFAVLLKEEGSARMRPVVSEGVPLEEVEPAVIGEGHIGEAVKRKQVYVRAEGSTDGPLAVVPLTTLEGAFGAVVIDELLVQKPQFTSVDHELFTLLGAHAATALQGALLRERAATPLDGITEEEAASLR